jgi:ferritin
MTKEQILEAIKDKMQSGDGDVFTFVDWLQEFVDEQLED